MKSLIAIFCPPFLLALGACSHSTNLSNDRALELVRETLRDSSDPYVRVQVRYGKTPEGIQWLVDKGFAEGAFGNWRGANGAIVDSNPWANFIAIPTHRKVLSIDGIATEDKQATVSWREAYVPNEPAYTTICVENPAAMLPNEDCSPRPATGTVHALRQDDGRWQLGGD